MNYTYNQMILYTVMFIFVASLISVNIHWGIAQDVKNGTLSKYIILPISYFFYKVFQFIGSKISDIILIGIGIAVVIFIFYKKNIIEVNPLQIGIFLLVAIVALLLQYLIYYCISGVAFWIGDCGGIFTVVNVISLVISGAVFPLDIFGDVVVKLSQLFPFYYITYFPTNVLIGKISGAEIISAIPIMVIWVLALIMFSKIIWKTGMKRYIAAGVFVSFFLLNFDTLSEHIKSGSLDTYIVKPISLQFIVTLRNVDLAFAFVSLIVGGTMVGIGWNRAEIDFSVVNIVGYLGFTLWGLFLTYSLFLIPNILSFWTVSSRGISQFADYFGIQL